MSNFHLKQTNHQVLSGGCNEPCMARMTQQLVGSRMDKNVELSWVRVWCEQPALLQSEKLDAFMMVHGNDFITLGADEALSEVEHVMSSHYTIKVRAVFGAGRDDAKEVRILN